MKGVTMNTHVDMTQFIAPKSDQLNADDLIAGPITIRISGVSANEGSPEQPISISFEGDDRKPYKPCKSMRRVMVHIWGADASKYVGRAMTLYRDPKVQFGGRSEEHTSELQSCENLVCRLLLEKKKVKEYRGLWSKERNTATGGLRRSECSKDTTATKSAGDQQKKMHYVTRIGSSEG